LSKIGINFVKDALAKSLYPQILTGYPRARRNDTLGVSDTSLGVKNLK